MMDAAEYLLQVNCLQEASPNIYKILLASLRSRRYAVFKSLLKRNLRKQPRSIEIDHVYPHPLSKNLLDAACCEGLYEFVELLLQLGANPNQLNTAHNRGPIHFATELGHVDVLRVLLADPRTNPNLEAGRETALHFAVRNNDLECIKVLLDNNASPNIANAKGATPMHVAAATSHIEMIEILLHSSRLAPDLDNFWDFRQKTPRDLIVVKFPAVKLPPKTTKRVDFNVLRFYLDANDEQHFLDNLQTVDINHQDIDVPRLMIMAAKRNFRNAVESLMERWTEKSTTVISEVALTSIRYGHAEILAVLLQSNIFKCTSEMLINACRELGMPASQSSNNQLRLECLKMILAQPGINVRCEDDKGNTPLHYAARADCAEAVSLLLKCGSYLGHMNILGIPPLAQIPPAILEEYFDECLSSNDDRTDNYEINFDYTCLMPHSIVLSNADEVENQSVLHDDLSSNSLTALEMDTLRYIAYNRSLKNLLKHPLLSSFLYLKWHRIRQVLYANFVFYILFYIFLNCYVLLITYESRPIKEYVSDIENMNTSTSRIAKVTWEPMSGLWCLLLISLIMLLLRETFQFISSPLHYVASFENWLEMILIILTSAVMIGAGSQVGAAAILLSAWELVILIGQHPRMSTGIEMFKTVSLNLIIFLLPYGLLILAFAMAFFTLFKDGDDTNFPDPGHSVFKTIIMLTGEFDANDIPFVSYPVFSRFIFVLFVFLIAIVLFNLLIGLAVSDTADILSKSELVGLISRTDLITYAERIVMGSSITRSPKHWNALFHARMFAFNYLAKRVSFFPHYLPFAKIAVKLNKANEIRIFGRTQETRKCRNFVMDTKIMLRSKDILSTRGKMTEHEKIMNSLEILQSKIIRLEDIMEKMNVASAIKTE